MDAMTSEEAEANLLYGALLEHCAIFAFQLERAPTTGYLHWQGYFELINKKRLGWIRQNVYDFDHLDKRKGTPLQAWTYSTKEETRRAGPWTFGTPTQAESGAQKSTELFLRDVVAGFDDVTLWTNHPSAYCRHTRVIDRVRSFNPPIRTSPLEVYLFFGPPGTGKTEFAYSQAELAKMACYATPVGKDFWLTPSIYGKKYIIIEEFKSNIALKDLLRMLDTKPIECPIKGNFTWWCPEIVVITTNVNPWEWYNYSARDFEREALFRRFTGVYSFAKNPEGVPRPTPVSFDDIKPSLPAPQIAANIRMADASGYYF